MDLFLSSFLALGVAALGFILAANYGRSSQDPSYELIPNCLLTRAPVLFITGSRSVFYFKKYWNIYPAYLAEHGYEVYTLRLPWRSRPLRAKALARALRSAREKNQSYHVVVDAWSLEDLQQFDSGTLKAFRSVNVIGTDIKFDSDLPCLDFLNADSRSPLLQGFYGLHRWLIPSSKIPSLATLGGTKGVQLHNARLLLERAQVLAERDHLELS